MTWPVHAFAVAFGATFFTTAPMVSALVAELFDPVRHGALFGATHSFTTCPRPWGPTPAGRSTAPRQGYEAIFLAGARLVTVSGVASLLVPATRPGARLA